MSALLISKLPLLKVIGAYAKFNPSGYIDGMTKREAVNWLTERVEQGHISMVDIETAPDYKPSATPTDNKFDAVSAVASRSESVALDALAKANTSITSVEEIKRKVRNLETKTADGVDIKAQVNKMIADAFRPFKQAVEDAGKQTVIADMTGAMVVETKTIEEVFGIKVLDQRMKDMTVDIWDHPHAPAIDSDFIWTEDILRYLSLAQTRSEHLWFGGLKGTGKSTVAEQFCARTGRNFVRINFHKHTSTEEYLGATGVQNGDTVFEPKDFLKAYATPSTVILLDEVTNADPAELAPLNGFLEPNPKIAFNGVIHTKANGVLVFVADNTYGNGDETGRHVGTRPQNSALIDRFHSVIPFDYLPLEREIEAVVSRTGVSEAIARHVMDAITVCRAKVQTGDVVEAPSIRRAMAFCKAIEVMPAQKAWQSCVVMHQPSESHSVLDAVFASCISQTFILDNL